MREMASTTLWKQGLIYSIFRAPIFIELCIWPFSNAFVHLDTNACTYTNGYADVYVCAYGYIDINSVCHSAKFSWTMS